MARRRNNVASLMRSPGTPALSAKKALEEAHHQQVKNRAPQENRKNQQNPDDQELAQVKTSQEDVQVTERVRALTITVK